MTSRIHKALTLAAKQPLAQEWSNQRFASLKLSDFRANVRIITTTLSEAPDGFESVWFAFGVRSEVLMPDTRLQEADAILLLCDITQPEQVQQILRYLNNLSDHAPPVYVLQHSMAPAERNTSRQYLVAAELFAELMEMGVDGILEDEPEQFALVVAVRAMLSNTQIAVQKMNGVLAARRRRAESHHALRVRVDHLLWTYSRKRLAPALPSVDSQQHSLRDAVAGFEFSELLGQGSCGTVYLLRPSRDDQGAIPQVAKVLAKSAAAEVEDVVQLNAQIEIMQLLSREEMRHPNVVCLHAVVHTPSHLVFRMEFGGRLNLGKRLAQRERPERQRASISTVRTASLMQQACGALAHLHERCHIAHRDIKPENFVVQEFEGDILLKLTDFDLAVRVDVDGALCCGACGTLPFAAPEILLEDQHDVRAADIWALGLLLLEMLCGVRIIERTLAAWPRSGQDHMIFAAAIRSLFCEPSVVQRLVTEHCRAECRPLLAAEQMLSGMLVVTPGHRVEAAYLSASFSSWCPWR